MASYTEHLNLLKKNPATDGADTFNIETMLNENWDKIDEAVAKKAELGADGKIPAEQLPEMNYDTAGSAEAVQKNLDAHTGNKSNPHGVTASQVGADPAGSAAAVQANLNSHTGNRGNPHGVTAAQVGAIPTTGGSVSEALNFANNVWNNVGDDVAFGDRNISGTLCIKGLNGAPGIRLYNQDESKSYQVYGEHNVTSGTGDIGAGSGLASGNIYLCYE